MNGIKRPENRGRAKNTKMEMKKRLGFDYYSVMVKLQLPPAWLQALEQRPRIPPTPLEHLPNDNWGQDESFQFCKADDDEPYSTRILRSWSKNGSENSLQDGGDAVPIDADNELDHSMSDQAGTKSSDEMSSNTGDELEDTEYQDSTSAIPRFEYIQDWSYENRNDVGAHQQRDGC
ncbi:uncharacterized protein EKO05_0009928 [Ascochyta rabiei]|uniref:uncharacterized protein n=1 Tax=Didymella rabiei TaxID=5454 RepID=UPI0022003ECF|nr:uncharacterized protein EKO05_0009928 [Ascochyta rabiei]UPX19673.1 hypothetical protein EKO05_0009928 [Ascochyta rabiei]